MQKADATETVVELFSAAAIADRVTALAREMIEAEGWREQASTPVFVCLLRGAYIFAADLARACAAYGVDPQIEFLHVSSYGAGTSSSGRIELIADVAGDLTDRDVVLVDDILDSGLSLRWAVDHIKAKGPRSVRRCVLLDKQRPDAPRADYVGFECPDRFVVGYGMDVAGRYRSLDYVGVLTRS